MDFDMDELIIAALVIVLVLITWSFYSFRRDIAKALGLWGKQDTPPETVVPKDLESDVAPHPEVIEPIVEEAYNGPPVEPKLCSFCGSEMIWRAYKRQTGFSDSTMSPIYDIQGGLFCSTRDPVQELRKHDGFESKNRPADFPQGYFEDFEAPFNTIYS